MNPRGGRLRPPKPCLTLHPTVPAPGRDQHQSTSCAWQSGINKALRRSDSPGRPAEQQKNNQNSRQLVRPKRDRHLPAKSRSKKPTRHTGVPLHLERTLDPIELEPQARINDNPPNPQKPSSRQMTPCYTQVKAPGQRTPHCTCLKTVPLRHSPTTRPRLPTPPRTPAGTLLRCSYQTPGEAAFGPRAQCLRLQC
jgi:hypothetical protein